MFHYRIPKRKRSNTEEINDIKRSKILDKNISGLSLVEDEELALQLLKNR